MSKPVVTALALLAAAGIFVLGYAFGTMEQTAITTGSDDRAILEAIATSVAPQPTPTPENWFLAGLPLCSDPAVAAGNVCLPVFTETSQFQLCEDFLSGTRREFAIPCVKQAEE